MAKTQSSLQDKRAAATASLTAENVAAPQAIAAKKAKPAARKTKAVAAKPAPVAKKSKAAPVAKSVPAVLEIVEAVIVKPAKAHKPKLVRDSFTIPKDEYLVLDALKGRALGLEQHVRKSELLRAGIQALAAMSDRAFLKAIGAVPTLKTGRPKID